MTVLLVWAIGASTLTWEHRKTTWLFLTFIVAAAAAGPPPTVLPDRHLRRRSHRDIGEQIHRTDRGRGR